MALAAILAGCSDDYLDSKTVLHPVQTGEEIRFGSQLTGDAEVDGTRTVYGDRDENGVPVNWKEAGDTIAIFCNQASQPANHLVDYIVKPDAMDPSTAHTVAKLNPAEAGLQWGDINTEHRFYAFYPASAVKGSAEENTTGQITANIPVTQQVTEWRTGPIESADPDIDGKECKFGLPNMNYAYMYAYNAVTPSQVEEGQAIDLEFHNLVTVLDLTLQGPESGDPITITNINIDAVDGASPILTGDFTCNIRATDSNPIGTCTPVGDFNQERSRISIPCYDKGSTDGFVKLGPGELMNVKAYIIPQDLTNTVQRRTLRVSVSMLDGAACRKTLETAAVTPHKINRVILPKLVRGGTNYWMSSIDPNTYASELSIPGSKISFATQQYDDELYMQGSDIETQFKDGVRAFIVSTQREDQNSFNSVVEEKGGWVSQVHDVESLEQTLSKIHTCLENAKTDFGNTNTDLNRKFNEFAFVQLTWCNNGGLFTDASAWLRDIASYINKLATENGNPYNIYTEEITAETTLGDLAGHIVIKVNKNSNMTSLGTNDRYPMLFSEWTSAAPEEDKPLYWGTYNEQKSTTMKWYATELTACGTSDGSWQNKQDYVDQVFDQGITIYQNGTQGTWLMNDLGGYNAGLSGHTRVTELTETLNQNAVDKLQTRTENASLGLVFMNFADKQENSGKLYKSDWLIQTIIDNNFKFALRERASSGNEGGTRTYNASYSKGGNAIGWDK